MQKVLGGRSTITTPGHGDAFVTRLCSLKVQLRADVSRCSVVICLTVIVFSRCVATKATSSHQTHSRRNNGTQSGVEQSRAEYFHIRLICMCLHEQRCCDVRVVTLCVSSAKLKCVTLSAEPCSGPGRSRAPR